MIYRLIRNATAKLDFGGTRFLLDPMLSGKGEGPSYAGRENSPLVPLPCKLWQVESGVDCLVVSHVHSDHFDKAAMRTLEKDKPLYCQPCEEHAPQFALFEKVRPFDTDIMNTVALQRVPAKHGSSEAVLSEMGEASGVVFMAAGEPNTYWTGDSIWCEEVKKTIDSYMPEVIIVHCGGALWNGELITMDADQVIELCRYAPEARVIAVHMDCCDHCSVSRAQLREKAEAAGIGPDRLYIPADYEELEFKQTRAF